MIRLLVLEDEPLIAEMLTAWAKENGCEVIGPVSSNRDALQLVEKIELDTAILDICVTDGDCYPVAERLQALDIPFAFATGLSDGAIDQRYALAPLAPKPFEFDQLRLTLLALVAGRDVRSAEVATSE
jgi:DNA-binding response OmpR family regulator